MGDICAKTCPFECGPVVKSSQKCDIIVLLSFFFVVKIYLTTCVIYCVAVSLKKTWENFLSARPRKFFMGVQCFLKRFLPATDKNHND